MSAFLSIEAGRRSLLSALVDSLTLITGCTHRDSVTVGAVPDDYRTNHPIVISERAEVLDIPVGAGQHGITKAQRVSLEGFLTRYDHSASSGVTIMVPSGSANEVVAGYVAGDLAHLIHKNGVPSHKIVTEAYSAPADSVAPIRVTYVAMKASVDRCGRWPEDILDTTENRHHADFGCSYQNNLAAQIDNPADLLGPRRQTEIDAENRAIAIEDYKAKDIDFDSEVDINF